jgi:hypothetical protein
MSPGLHTLGFAVAIPPGWDVRVRGAVSGPDATVDYPVMHAANFALPPRRGDFGGGVVETMTTRHVFVAVLGYGPGTVGTETRGLFATAGLPHPLRPEWFDPSQMQRLIAGKAGLQRFFSAEDRRFCLYAVVGSYARRAVLVPLINGFLAGVTIEPASAAGGGP